MKKVSKIISALAVAVTAITSVFAFSACGSKAELLQENIIDDKYDNYYEVFVYSYCDSDGDGIGDFNGLTSKLDYIRDMGYTGIWLMPVNPSPSYHGYDVTDYYGVNPKYGTLDDYKNLLDEAHERDIKIIMDLVVNHTSSQHPWFRSGLSAAQGKGGDAKYRDWYTFTNKKPTNGSYSEEGGVWYEANFDKGMPDLNLKNESLRVEIENIIKFWLETGVDGFRLDGCKYYCPLSNDSIEFCSWIQTTAEKYKEDVYIVGEMWAGRNEIKQYYTSGVDSFFYFVTNENVRDAINIGSAAELWAGMYKCDDTAGEYIPAPFLSNHDNGVGRFSGRVAREEDKIKFGYGLLSMYAGCTFTYYGDEIGMVSKNSASDPDLRIGMLWDNKKTNITKAPPGASKTQEYIFDGVEEQQKDANSILNYYKLCNNARNAFPALMRGKSVRIPVEDSSVLAFKRTYNGEAVTVVINLAEEKKTVEGIEGTLAQDICVKDRVSQSGTTLKMPAYSIAILT